MDPRSGVKNYVRLPVSLKRHEGRSGGILPAEQNLDRVAPAGALLVAAWPRIEGATGLPARVLAITPKK